MRRRNASLRRAKRAQWPAGGWIGAGAGAIAGLEILLGNPVSCSPRLAPASCLLVVAAFAGVGLVLGAAFGVLGARLFAALRGAMQDGRSVLGFLAPALVFLPGLAALAVVPYLALRVGRRRLFPRRARLDSLLALLLLGAAAASIPSHSPPPAGRSRELRGAPVPGSIPVIVTLHSGGDFPETAAVHPPTQSLDASLEAKREALWSGRIPLHSGHGGRHTLPGGGTIAWLPPRPWANRLVSLLARPASAPPAGPAGLAEIARAAGIPLLDTAPDPGDPPLTLRILELSAPVTAEDAQRFRASGAWIDVTLAEDEKIALAGEGIRLTPASVEASLLDVFPTTLHLLGLAVPRDADGRVLVEILDPLGPGSRTPRYGRASSSASTTRR